MDLGDARFEARTTTSALEQYRAADEIMTCPPPASKWAAPGTAGQAAGRRETFAKSTEFPQRADEPRPFASARQRADRLLGDIAPRIPRVTLQVTGCPKLDSRDHWDGQRIEEARIGGYLEANQGVQQVVGTAAAFPKSNATSG